MELEVFSDMFSILLDATGKRDDEGKLTKLYYSLLQQTDPTPQELWNAITVYIESQERPAFPVVRELKQIIWDDRKSKQAALPAAQPKAVEPHSDEAKLGRLTVMRIVYQEQGDCKFYRAALANRSPLVAAIPEAKVTHRDVLTACGIEEEPHQQQQQPIEPRQKPAYRRRIDPEKRDKALSILWGE